jgi:hypothetical protein
VDASYRCTLQGELSDKLELAALSRSVAGSQFWDLGGDDSGQLFGVDDAVVFAIGVGIAATWIVRLSRWVARRHQGLSIVRVGNDFNVTVEHRSVGDPLCGKVLLIAESGTTVTLDGDKDVESPAVLQSIMQAIAPS